MEYNKKLFEALKKIDAKNDELNKALETVGSDIAKMKEINIQLKQTEKVAAAFKIYSRLIEDGLNAEEMLQTETDKDMLELLRMDLENSKEKIPTLEEEMKILLLPVDPNNGKNVIVEMRPAAGGDEASIFVSDLFDTYKRYIENQGWKLKVLDLSTQAHGFDFISFMVSGEDVYSKLKFESGVHRVQRVPATESKGRVHTSTITVAVLPEQDDVEITINPSDLRVDTYRASGAGGQHVNRTESAVRITHNPTGIVVACQEAKSQIENRDIAMRMLRSKLWEAAEAAKHEEQANERKSQVGTGERSEKIRTYNYPQNRVTDHRIGLTLNKLDQVMMGNLEEIIDMLIADEQASLMSTLEI
ncbi:peptide chain release factor 1 [Ureaplasma ceti]|uniref:Peptide chain release factor 1 n=1 Tax=Ureaplasma ceti TaxID=3119530 RepID=A0ABP9U7Z3_9BACT